DLQGALRERQRLFLVAALLERTRQRDARRDGIFVALHDLAQHLLALRRVAAEETREPQWARARRRERVEMMGCELERAVDLRHQPTELEHRGDLLAVEAQKFTQIAEHAVVPVDEVVVRLDRLFGERLTLREELLALVATL